MNRFLLGLTYLRPGQLPGSRDVTLSIVPGEGQALLDPNVPPALGTLDRGRLVIASESFPRFAPLTLIVRGVDLRFTARAGRLLSLTLRDRGEDCLKLACNGLQRAAYRHVLSWRPESQITLQRINSLDGDRRTRLDVHVLKGSIGAGAPGFEKDATGVVQHGKLELRRAPDGELRLQMHGARMEWDVAGGNLQGLRVFDSKGAVAHFNLLDLSGAGVTASVAVLDTLP